MNKNEIESRPLKKTLVASGKDYGFYLLDFTVGDKIIKDYETIEPLKESKAGFHDCSFLPIISKIPIISQKQWTFLTFTYSPPLNRFVLSFPSFEINSEEFLEVLTVKYEEITGIPLKNYELLDNIKEIPNIYSDPACVNKKSKAVSLRISCEEVEFLQLEERKDLVLFEIEGDLCEKLKEITKEKDAILSDKVWYWALGKMFKKGIF